MYSDTLRRSDIYLKYANQPLSTFSASDIYTDLQNITRCGVEELEIFDYLNRLLQALQMNSSGMLINYDAKTDSLDDWAWIQNYSQGTPTISLRTGSTSAASNYGRRYGIIQSTLTGGASSNVVLVSAKAGYYGVFEILSITSDTEFTPTLVFQSEDDAALTNQASFLPVLTIGVPNFGMKDVVMRLGTDNKALEVDITGGAGTEKLYFVIEYWYET